MLIGLIGSILAIVGVFLPWLFYYFILSDYWLGISGLYMAVPGFSYYSAYVPLVGGITALIGCLAILKGRKLMSFLFLTCGGIIASLGGVVGYFDMGFYILRHQYHAIEILKSGYGFYICIIGGVLALIGGALSLKAKWKRS